MQDLILQIQAQTSQRESPKYTMAEMKEVVRNCAELGLLDTKHCDVDGDIQQYFKTSAEFEDYATYKSLTCGRDPGDVAFDRWWMRSRQGEYPPGEPSAETRDQYKPIIDRFFKGERVHNSLLLQGGIGEDGMYVPSDP
jgi:hypothetical protein